MPDEWRNLPKGGDVPSDLWSSAYNPDHGTPFDQAGRLSPSYAERQRKRQKLRRGPHGVQDEKEDLDASQNVSSETVQERADMESGTGQLSESGNESAMKDTSVLNTSPQASNDGAQSTMKDTSVLNTSPQANDDGDRRFRSMTEESLHTQGYGHSRAAVQTPSPVNRSFSTPVLFDADVRQSPLAHQTSTPLPVPPTMDAESQASISEAADADDAAFSEESFDAPLPRGRYRYDRALAKGCVAAVALARAHARALGLALVERLSDFDWTIVGRNILWSMNEELLWGLVDGNVIEMMKDEESSVAAMTSDGSAWMEMGKEDAPVLYMVALVNGAGLAPTPRKMRKAIQMLRAYVSLAPGSFTDALAVDNAFRQRSSEADIRASKHFFLVKEEQNRRMRVRGRIDTVITFCNALEARLARESETEDTETKPMRRPLNYIGYALRFAVRRKQHETGETSFLMHLVNNVFQALFPAEYNLQSLPICFLAEKMEVRCGEVLLTLLADSFSFTGGGFNTHPPGINNSSADMISSTVGSADEIWDKCEQFGKRMPYFRAAVEREMGSLMEASSNETGEEYQDSQQERLAKIERLIDERGGAANRLKDQRVKSIMDDMDDIERQLSIPNLLGVDIASTRQIVGHMRTWTKQAAEIWESRHGN